MTLRGIIPTASVSNREEKHICENHNHTLPHLNKTTFVGLNHVIKKTFFLSRSKFVQKYDPKNISSNILKPHNKKLR